MLTFLALSLFSTASAQEGSMCEYADILCNRGMHSLGVEPIEKVDFATDKQSCHDSCYNRGTGGGEECTNWVLAYARGQPVCTHLSLCAEVYDDCMEGFEQCAAGRSDCSLPEPITICPSIPAPTGNKAPWICNIDGKVVTGVDPPIGTKCFQRCNSDGWKTVDGYAELRTECLTGGVWAPVTSTEEGVPAFPDGGTEFPAPDVDSMTCGCIDLELMFNGAPYNPNEEEAAEFICTDPLNDGNGDGSLEIVDGNTCNLYCDGFYVTTATCDDRGEWTGEPNWGFWCYDEPNATPNPNPPPPF